MIEHRSEVEGDPVVIRVVENEDDLEGFRNFIRANLRVLGLDSETTGLDIYSDKFRCRLVQFGTRDEAWVVPVELGPRYCEDVRLALRGVGQFILHNASFDLQVFEQTLGVPMESMWPKVTDTRILAHLVDPTGQDEGGKGQGLEAMTRFYIDEGVASNIKTLMKDLAKANKTTVANVWKRVPLSDPHYQLYSGMDPILAARLVGKLAPLVPAESEKLIAYEHKLAEVCSYMDRTGFLLDVEYSEKLSEQLKFEESRWAEKACDYGCTSINSNEQVADVIEGLGYRIIGRTPSGNRQVNEALLGALAAGGDGIAPELKDFAFSIIESKKAKKWRKTWVDTFLTGRDSGNRCHASINPLRARTARMSISGIPAQTLPSGKGEWTIRRCFLADEGHRIASIDYKAQELRVLAVLSGDERMIQAFLNDEDLHQVTADSAGVIRDVGKMANFLKVYGGGAKKLADSAGIPVPAASRVIAGFDRAYPQVKVLSHKLQQEAARTGRIVTPMGRVLPVDEDRAYAALNYDIQSMSRDVTAKAVIRLHDAGFTPYLRLPIHDEILASVPEAQAEWGAAEIGRIMAEQMGPLVIDTDAEVGGRSWGSLYGADY